MSRLADVLTIVSPLAAVFPVALMPAAGKKNAVYQIARSLRCNSADSAYLSRTPSTTSNRKKNTLSLWMKRHAISSQGTIIGCATNSDGEVFDILSDQLRWGSYNVGSVKWANLLRDPTAWMHIVFVLDTDHATSSERLRCWVNNVRLATTGTPSWPSSGAQTQRLNVASVQNNLFGNVNSSSPAYNHATVAEIHWIDGQALDPTYFGEVDPITGAWCPKEYSGSYGTNGFYLDFSDNSNTTAATLGADRSGNGNNWTPNNFSVSAGAGNDSITDTPTNYGTDTGAGGEVRGNYCTWNPAWAGASAPTNGNLDSPSGGVARGTMALLAFDAYWEITSTGGTSTAGVVSEGGTTNTTTIANGKTYGFRLTTGGELDYKNITDGGAWTSIATGLTGVQYPYTSGAAATVASLNAGQRPFAAAAPSGLKALCTHNIAVPLRPDNYFTTHTRTGTGSAGSVSGKRFQPDIVWSKSRSTRSHMVADAVRGTGKYFSSDAASDETSDSQTVTAFNSDGFSFGTAAILNTSAEDFIDWMWKESQASGIDIVTYTGNGTNRTISHDLGAAPKLIIVKARTTAGTDIAAQVWHSSIANTEYLVLSTTAAKATGATRWDSTSPTSSVFSLGTADETNASGDTFVAYLFAEVSGFSRIASYTGNGSNDGPFLWCGFRPALVLVKRVDSTGDWYMWDNARETANPRAKQILANSTAAEGSTGAIDFLSNGFKLRATTAGFNASGGTYVFMAFADVPEKYSRAA